jgi:hypothetical protein
VFEPAGVVHRGEYVQPQHIVRQPGVLAFMEMLRRSGDLAGTISQFMRGFSVGGFATSLSHQLAFEPPRLSYAGGGLVNPAIGALHPVTINFPGQQPVRGLLGSPDIVKELEKRALFDQMRSSLSPSRGSRR